MSAKYFCDGCGKEMPKKEHKRLIVGIGKIKVEVMHSVNGTWNSGEVCWDCLRKIVAPPSIESTKQAALMKLLAEAVIAMSDDGWLAHGPEGMIDAQKKCYEAYAALQEKQK